MTESSARHGNFGRFQWIINIYLVRCIVLKYSVDSVPEENVQDKRLHNNVTYFGLQVHDCVYRVYFFIVDYTIKTRCMIYHPLTPLLLTMCKKNVLFWLP